MKPACFSLVRAALKRFAEALQRSRRPVSAVSLVRARTPHTPQGRALERRPLGSRERARFSEALTRSRGAWVLPTEGRRLCPREQPQGASDVV
jgi:hypothetical protein